MIALERIDAARSHVRGLSIDATLYATREVEIDRSSIASLSAFDTLREDVSMLGRAHFLTNDAGIERIVLTPDFHRGATLPVGAVIATRDLVLPAAIGNDIGCGMALAVLDGVRAGEIVELWPILSSHLRHAFFQGGRSILIDAEERRAVLSDGVRALDERVFEGVWPDAPRDFLRGTVSRLHGVHDATIVPGSPFEEWIAPGGRLGRTREPLLGTIGGGNHFVEIQRIERIVDRRAAYDFGLARDGVAIMVHSGCVGLGRAVATVHEARTRARYPSDVPHVKSGVLALSTRGRNADLGRGWLDDMIAATRFAVVNRLFLSLMARLAIARVLGRSIGWRLVADLAHNAVWETAGGYLHRKGACPSLAGAVDSSHGYPVIVPGSMGTASAILEGLGNPDCLASAPHGAGRSLSRNAARADASTLPPRLVGPVALETARHDIRREAEKRLAEEAPRAYKPIEPIVETMVLGSMARDVARLVPIATIKG